MFTGIIEEIGKVQTVRRAGEAIEMVIEAKEILKDVGLGDSIAVNGVCLTVTSYSNHLFTVDVMPETIHSTSLKDIKARSKVNLERAMAAGGRFGGHFVSGHVDGVGVIVEKKPLQNAVYYKIQVPDVLKNYLVVKGSVSVDGTSLTIFAVEDNVFTISLIPHTMEQTVIGLKGSGDNVNIECDMLVKYMDHLINRKQQSSSSESKLSMSFLEQHGFN